MGANVNAYNFINLVPSVTTLVDHGSPWFDQIVLHTNMDFKQFMEMPLANLKHLFDLPPGQGPTGRLQPGFSSIGGFIDRDRNMITHPAWAKKLESVLSRTHHRFNILMIEGNLNWRLDFKTKVTEFMEQNGMPVEGHITFAKNSSTGDPLTPWMVLHTLAHALCETVYGEKVSEEIEVEVDKIDHALEKVDGSSKNVFMFRSAVRNNAVNEQEFVHEIIAEYLWHGGTIRINPEFSKITPYIKKIEQSIKGLLDSAVGKVIYDFFNG